jgi:hypothetical protein
MLLSGVTLRQKGKSNVKSIFFQKFKTLKKIIIIKISPKHYKPT